MIMITARYRSEWFDWVRITNSNSQCDFELIESAKQKPNVKSDIEYIDSLYIYI